MKIPAGAVASPLDDDTDLNSSCTEGVRPRFEDYALGGGDLDDDKNG